jgi:hypothetical protein
MLLCHTPCAIFHHKMFMCEVKHTDKCNAQSLPTNGCDHGHMHTNIGEPCNPSLTSQHMKCTTHMRMRNTCNNTLIVIASAMQLSTRKYADLNDQRDADADFNGSEMLICRSQCRHIVFDQQIHCLQLHQRCRFQRSNMLISTIREGSEMLTCRSQCRHTILFDQQYIGEGGFLSAAGNGAVQNNF